MDVAAGKGQRYQKLEFSVYLAPPLFFDRIIKREPESQKQPLGVDHGKQLLPTHPPKPFYFLPKRK